MQGAGCRIYVFGFRVSGFWLRDGSELLVSGFWFLGSVFGPEVSVFRFKVSVFRFQVSGFGLWIMDSAKEDLVSGLWSSHI